MRSKLALDDDGNSSVVKALAVGSDSKLASRGELLDDCGMGYEHHSVSPWLPLGQ